jgi:hypothetical protein
MKPADWQELSAVLGDISSHCAKVTTSSSAIASGATGSSNPSFVATLELLLRLGQVTSCLLCVNGDDRSFSIARVAQVGGIQAGWFASNVLRVLLRFRFHCMDRHCMPVYACLAWHTLLASLPA